MFILNRNNKVFGLPLALFFIVILLCFQSKSHATVAVPASNATILQGGWYAFDPYQYQTEEHGLKVLTGLDYELMKVIAKDVGVKLQYEKVNWDDLLKNIESGKEDFATGALYSKEREKYAYFSVPYRYEEDSLFVLKEKARSVSHKSLKDLLEYMQASGFKLGVVEGFIYTDPLINEFIDRNSNAIVKTKNDYENLDLLLNKEIDGFITDRIVGATEIWRLNVGKKVFEVRLNIEKPVHIIFSKKTVSLDLVNQFNQAIHKLKDTTSYQKIVSWYLYPILFLQTEDRGWFRITEILGTIAFAISGLIIAFKERATLLGALILAVLPSLGGGIMRDVIFDRNPVGALQSPIYLLSVLVTVGLGFIFIKLLTHLRHLRHHYHIPGEIEDTIRKQAGHILIITDAIGLATFTVTGVIVCLSAKVEPLWLWGPFFAFLTGAGGGILRDMLSKTRYIAALEGELYGEIAVVWGLFLSIIIMINTTEIEPERIEYAVIITIIGAFCTRLWVHFFHVPNERFGKES